MVIDPRRIDLTDHSVIWLRQRPGTDIAVINGLMNVILEEKAWPTWSLWPSGARALRKCEKVIEGLSPGKGRRRSPAFRPRI